MDIVSLPVCQQYTTIRDATKFPMMPTAFVSIYCKYVIHICGAITALYLCECVVMEVCALRSAV